MTKDMHVSNPIIDEVNLREDYSHYLKQTKNDYLLKYPTVYVMYHENNKGTYDVYVGETNDIIRRTDEHLKDDKKDFHIYDSMYVIGHEHFNKSLTLDIENQMMGYVMSATNVTKLHNGRTNPQYDYFPVKEFENIFSKVWKKLRIRNEKLFPLESAIQDNAIFKASPYKKLSKEQNDDKNEIINHLKTALTNQNQDHQLIIVEGEAGTGKTILLSNLFATIAGDKKDFNDLNIYMLVNHNEQEKVYASIAKKLGIEKKDSQRVMKPTTFLNTMNKNHIEPDIVLVDEAHLLLTQYNQAYTSKNGTGRQIDDIVNKAKVTVAVFDKQQFLKTEQVMNQDKFNELIKEAKEKNNYISLNHQFRMAADEKTINWIKDLVYRKIINNIPNSDKYDLKIFDNPQKMYQEIEQKNQEQDNGASRIVATYDWKYSTTKKKDHTLYDVTVGDDFKMPWNNQILHNKKVSWLENEDSINEVGSTYTVQGFDLNYVGVIIGPSVKYRNGHVIYDKDASANTYAIKRRTMKDGSKQYVYDQLLPNELNVLLTRGVNGLYIYAVDKELRDALLKAQAGMLTE